MSHTLRTEDADIKRAVEAELSWLPSVDSNHIGVAVNDGAVTLTGQVDSYPQKILAGKAALRVRGVTAIAQEIQVHGPWSKVDDTDIAREATEELQRAVNVPATVKAAVTQHMITLSGEVEWNFQRDAAVRAVRHLKGVTNIANAVTIRPTVLASGVKASITAALLRNAEFEGKHITVTTDLTGHVTLEGNVRSWAERRQVEKVSWSAPGVTAITNKLTVLVQY